MAAEEEPAVIQACRANDLTCGKACILIWCLPTFALFLGLQWATARPWLWIPALLVMGVGCAVNARRCGRVHCYVTGPMFLLAAVYVALAEFGLVPMHPGIFLLAVLGTAALACLAELPLGRYKAKAQSQKAG